jgi:hypothetical protein
MLEALQRAWNRSDSVFAHYPFVFSKFRLCRS